MSHPTELPRWMDLALLPAVNLAIALLVAGVIGGVRVKAETAETD